MEHKDKIIKIVCTIMNVLLMILWLPVIFLSLFIFDDPHAVLSPLTWLLAISIWTAPYFFKMAIAKGQENKKGFLFGLVGPVLTLFSILLIDSWNMLQNFIAHINI